MKYTILPTPKEIIEHSGVFHLKNCAVCVSDDLDPRVIKSAVNLRTHLVAKTDSFHKFSRIPKEKSNCVLIEKNTTISPEGYRIDINENGIYITGGNDAGCFYGIKTLLQIIDSADENIDAMTINDSPDMAYRGFYYDATRGRVPTVKGIKQIINTISNYKMNSLQLYVEHSFDFDEFKTSIRTEDDYLTADDILEIDEYCYNNFIDFVPSLSTFGHLYELLIKNEYKHLCELKDYEASSHFWWERMKHHTIDPSNPESFEVVSSLIDQYLPLFRSKYFNICCDETFDLAQGRNQGKDKAELYIDFVSKITDHITKAGKTVMMWGDIALAHPHLLPRIPEGTVLLNWDYGDSPNTARIKNVSETGISQIVCPGTAAWMGLIELTDQSVPNILKMVQTGLQYGAFGMLNTNWGDLGHPCNPECSLYGTVLGACASWNSGTNVDDEYNKSFSKLVYGSNADIVPIIGSLCKAQRSAAWKALFDWTETRDSSCFVYDEASVSKSIDACRKIHNELKESSGLLQFLSIAAQGIGILNEAVLKIKQNGHVDICWKRNAGNWFEVYKKQWLNSSKSSELCEIESFLKKI